MPSVRRIRSAALMISIGLVATPKIASAQDSGRTALSPAGDNTPFITLFGAQRFGFDPVVLQPGSHVFFITGKLDQGEIEIFKDGKLAVDIQLFGGDLVYYRKDGKMRAGLNLGLGVTQFSDASVLLSGGSLFVQVGGYYRIDAGWMGARSAKSDLDASQRDQTAWFTGVSFPTKLGELLKNALK